MAWTGELTNVEKVTLGLIAMFFLISALAIQMVTPLFTPISEPEIRVYSDKDMVALSDNPLYLLPRNRTLIRWIYNPLGYNQKIHVYVSFYPEDSEALVKINPKSGFIIEPLTLKAVVLEITVTDDKLMEIVVKFESEVWLG